MCKVICVCNFKGGCGKSTSVANLGYGLAREAERLLASAEMAFNPDSKRDKLVMKCIQSGQYDINEVNLMLYLCNLPLLGNILDEKDIVK